MSSIYYDNIKYSGGGGNISEIDDTIISIDKTWSSNKINLTKQDKLTFDTAPTENSTNPVTSDGIYNYINIMITQALTGSY